MQNKTIYKLLRKGLMTNNQSIRNTIIRDLQKEENTQERNYAVAGLKDKNTSLDDLIVIESGDHYKNWITHNIKEEVNVMLLKEENILNNFTEDSEGSSIPIIDSFGKHNDLKLNVNLEKILNTEIGDRTYGSLSMPKSNDKIMQCLKIFDDQLSLTDKNDIIDSLILQTESIKKKREKKASKKTFVDAVNQQLSDDERKDFIALLISRAKTFYGSFGSK